MEFRVFTGPKSIFEAKSSFFGQMTQTASKWLPRKLLAVLGKSFVAIRWGGENGNSSKYRGQNAMCEDTLGAPEQFCRFSFLFCCLFCVFGFLLELHTGLRTGPLPRT